MSESNIELTEEAKRQLLKLLGVNISPDKEAEYHHIIDDAIRKTSQISVSNVKNLVPHGLLESVGDSLIEGQIQNQKSNLKLNLEIPEFISKYGAGLFGNTELRSLNNSQLGKTSIDGFIDYVNQVKIDRGSFLTSLLNHNLSGVDSVTNNQLEISAKYKDRDKYLKYSLKDVGKDIDISNIRQVPNTTGVDQYPSNGFIVVGDQSQYNFGEKINKYSSEERREINISDEVILPKLRTGNGYLIGGRPIFKSNSTLVGFERDGTFTPHSSIDLLTDIVTNNTPNSVKNDSQLGQDGFIGLKDAINNRIKRAEERETYGRIGGLTDAKNDPLGFGVSLLKGNNPPVTISYEITTLPGFLTAFDLAKRISGIDPGISTIPEDSFGSSLSNSFNNVKKTLHNIFPKFVGGAECLDCDTNPNRLTPPHLPKNKTLLRHTSSGQLLNMYNTLSYNKFSPEWLKDPDATDIFGKLIPKPSYNLYIDSDRKYPVGSQLKGILGLPVKEPDSNYLLDNTDPARLSDSPDNSGLHNGKLSDNFVEYGPNNDGTGVGGGRISTISIKPGDNKDIYWESNEPLPINLSNGNPYISTDDPFIKDGNGSSFKTIKLSHFQGKGLSFNNDSILCSTQKLADRDDIIGDVVRNSTRNYRGLSKGNAVKWPNNDNNKEFCRVWTKDKGYNQISDLVRKGYRGYGRGLMVDTKFTTLDSNGMPIIAPTKRDTITNEFGENVLDPTIAKRYMLSIENLAWLNAKVYLPCGEVGPNGGRIMWFPPYDISFNDNSSVNWTENNFIGRPEPIYTYNNATRAGNISFSLIVDHPSIVDHVNNDYFNTDGKGKKPGELEAFFADCINYSVEELLQKYKEFDTDIITQLNSEINKNTRSLDLIFSGSPRIYFDNDLPGNCTVDKGCDPKKGWDVSEFETGYNNYKLRDVGVDPKTGCSYLDNTWLLSNSGRTEEVKTFFKENGTLQGGYDDIQSFIELVKNKLRDIKSSNQNITNVNIFIPLESNTSYLNQDGKPNYNKDLSIRRELTLRTYLEEKIKTDEFSSMGITFNNGGNSVLKEAASSTIGIQTTPIVTDKKILNDQNDPTAIYSPEAFGFRYSAVNIRGVKIKYADGEPINLTDGITKERIDQLKVKMDYYNEQYRRLKAGVLQPYSRECEMFEKIKDIDPFIYQTLVEKLKYFHPAFHSTTPEGFNSRLTFLKQCGRAGDSISADVAKNTSFGPPPVCILRVGDFYHTKIIINSINISYDPMTWDMNYEGIGMQPLIAKVDLSFNYVGGSSLGGPINQLQNALSFNYFANTSLYDNRAKLSKEEEQILSDTIKQKEFDDRMKFVSNGSEINNNTDEELANLNAIENSQSQNNDIEQLPSIMNQDKG